MDRFLLIFHDDLIANALQPPPDQLPPDSAHMWMHWFRQMAVQNQLGWVMICPLENIEDTVKPSEPEVPEC